MVQQPSKYIPPAASIAAAIFEAIEGSQPRTITDDQLISLHFLFDKTLEKALKIVDKGLVQCFTAEASRRKLFVVHGRTAADAYAVFPDHYCACPAFQFDVVGKNDSVYCKHQLAARLGDALGRCTYSEVADHTLSNMLMS